MQYTIPISLLLSTSLLQADWTLIDDMEGTNNWIGAGTIEPEPDNPANNVYTLVDTTAKVPAYLPLPDPIPEGTTGTIFFRFRSSDNSGLVDWVVGSSDVAAPTNWPDYEGYVRLAEDGVVGDFDIDVRTGGTFTEVGPAEVDTWIYVWLVLDNTADTTDAYYNLTGSDATSPETVSFTGAGFRNGTTEDLITLFVNLNERGTTGLIDDIYIDLAGENLTNPTSSDSDNDGLPDPWEITYFGDLSKDGSADSDGDNLTDFEEFEEGTNPTLKDTDGDNLDDDVELSGSANTLDNSPTNPSLADSDGDGFNDDIEIAASSNPNDASSAPARAPGFHLIENFESEEMIIGETFADLNGWTTTNPNAIRVSTDPANSNDKVGQVTRLTDTTISASVSKSLDEIGLQLLEGDTGTLFFQVFATSENVNTSFGLSDVASPTVFGDFEAQGVLFTGNLFRVRDEAVFRDQATYAAGTWMNVWVVADNENDLVRIHVESPDGETSVVEITDDGGLDPFNFRNGTTSRLSSILLIAAVDADPDSSILIDNVYFDPTAENLTRPVASKGAPGEIKITETTTNAHGDLIITFTPGGEGFILTTADNLSSPFTEVASANFDGANTFTIVAEVWDATQKFYRVERP